VKNKNENKNKIPKWNKQQNKGKHPKKARKKWILFFHFES